MRTRTNSAMSTLFILAFFASCLAVMIRFG